MEWEISRLAASLNFARGVTVPGVLQSSGWATGALIVFVVIGGCVRLSLLSKVCCFEIFTLSAFLKSIFKKSGKMTRLCVVSTTTLLCLMKCSAIFCSSSFFITTKSFANVFSPVPNLNVVVLMGFSNLQFPTCFLKFGRSSFLKTLVGACCLFLPSSLSVMALTWALESTGASIVRSFLEIYRFSSFRSRTIVEEIGI